MDQHQAQAALEESARRRQQTIDAGTAPWPWRTVMAFAGTLVAFGLCLDADLVWLGVLLVVGVGAATTRAVTLRRTGTAGARAAALAGVAVLALAADVAVQFAVRGAQLPLPNTLGAVAAAAVVVLLVRRAQGRSTASARR